MRVPRPGNEFRQEIPATLAAVEDFCMGARRWALSVRLPSRFAAELLVREAMVNAATHGCGCDPSKRVTGVLRLRPGRLIVAVRDQGLGFDWRAAYTRAPDETACRGRGIDILKQYANRLRFNRRGNSLIVVKRLPKEGNQ